MALGSVPHEVWFQKLKVEWSTIAKRDDGFLFSSFKQFEQFIISEKQFWESFNKGSFDSFRNNSIQMMQFLNEASREKEDEKVFISNIRHIIEILRNQVKYLPSYLKETQLIARLYRENPVQAEAAYRTIFLRELSPNLESTDMLIGTLEAIHYIKSSTLGESVKREAEQLDALAAKYHERLELLTGNYYNSRDEFVSKINNKLSDLDTFTNEVRTSLSSEKTDFQANMIQWKDSIVQLEKQYGELMKLKKPAEYWDMLYTEYTDDGRKWRWWTLGTSAAFVATLFPILYFFPEWLKGNTWTFDHVKGVILLAIIISVFSYLINLFVRLSISSFHLAKDAKERFQLTYVYLSMISEKAIDPDKDRQIILQALFSRADTGLLKNDGAPTMPSVQNIIELAKK